MILKVLMALFLATIVKAVTEKGNIFQMTMVEK